MQVKYPINTTANPSSEAALQELISKIRTESTGHYLISEGGGWHGGIHITEKSHPNHSFEPVRALACGQLVAYRITQDYQESTFQNKKLKYSNSFCLLRHQYQLPDSQNTFTFYSLYMHLRPLKHLPGLLYRLKSDRNTRNAANPANHSEAPKLLSSGTLIECLPDAAEQHPLGGNEYLFIKAREYKPTSDQPESSFWIALHQANKPSFYTDAFEAQDTHPRWCPQPTITLPTDRDTHEDPILLPEVEQQPEIQLNQLVILDTPIPISAGDPLGYLGLHERLCRVGDGSTEHSYQIHLETFAIEPPPQVLFNTEDWRWMKKKEITDHEGNPQENNTFFKDLVTSLDDNNDDHLSSREVQNAYRNEGTAKSLEHLISHHASEWHDDANRKQYTSWELHLGQVRASINGKIERKAFYERLQYNLRHEKERLTELKWLDEAQRRLGLTKEVWHLHPIRLVHQIMQNTGEDVLSILREKLKLYEGQIPHMYRDSRGYVTVGTGHLLKRVNDALDVEFLTPSGELATREQVIEEYERLKSFPKRADGSLPPSEPSDYFHNYTASSYKDYTSLKINGETIDEQINTHIDRFTRDLSRIYSGFYNMPSNIKLVLYDMIFNLGSRGLEFTFKNFTMYIKNSDWLSAANESYRRDVNYERNNYVRELLEQAARED